MGRLLILRHGQSEWNAAGLWQGLADVPLTELGASQARQAGRALADEGIAVGAVVSSALVRARATAELLAQELGYYRLLEVDPDLNEHDIGDWSGLSTPEVEERWPGMIEALGRHRLPVFPGGEETEAFEQRARRAVLRLARLALECGDADVVAVSHGGLLASLERWTRVWQPDRRHGNLSGWWLSVTGSGADAGVEPDEAVDLLSSVPTGASAGPEATEGAPCDDDLPGSVEDEGRSAVYEMRAPMVRVVRSPRRRKTVSARLVGEVVELHIPASMGQDEEEHWICEMLRRLGQRHQSYEIDLAHRAAALSGRYGLRSPVKISWSDNQRSRWGSCTPGRGTIRISRRLAKEPPWVLDYVIMHELAHLHVRSHNKSFWDIVARYPLAERARGFLMARGVEDTEPDAGGGPLPAL